MEADGGTTTPARPGTKDLLTEGNALEGVRGVVMRVRVGEDSG